jgi:hypothetical protein
MKRARYCCKKDRLPGMFGDFPVARWNWGNRQNKRPSGRFTKETFDLAFFDLKEVPELFNQAHQDMFADALKGKAGVYR